MLKTILVHVDQSVHAPARMRYAASLARATGAHLVGAAMLGVSRSIFPNGYEAGPGTLSASCFQPLADQAAQALARFAKIAGEWEVHHEKRFVCDQADDGLARMARFADLVVVSQDDPGESMPDMAVRLPDYLILNCARPVVVVPRSDPPPWHNPKIMVAWDGGKEASFALSASVPLLRRAGGVTLVALAGPQAAAEEFEAEQSDLKHYLKRHHVTPHLLVREARHDTGRELLALGEELGCGMLVMGCYGHGRFRELCIGGASRTVLADAAIPVLLAH